jgi:ligand-binding SRPBCC domain-containing protein
MKLRIRTRVNQNYQRVWAGFDRELFLLLSPPFPPISLLRFDGCHRGDVVEVELNFLFFRQVWKSEIVDQQMGADEISFVDEGRRLPFFLKYWRHRHRILRRDNQSEIVDDITFRSPFVLLDYVLYPVMYLQFAYRRPIYRKVFA